MHVPGKFTMFVVLVPLLALGACGNNTPAAPAAEVPAAKASDNPLAGTALADQGEALRKARAVEETLQKSAEQRNEQIDQEGQ